VSDLKKIAAYIEANRDELKRQGLQLHDDHGTPKTRRELLACGFYSAVCSLALPSVGSMLLASNQANAANASCQLGTSVNGIPFLQINFSGGRNLWGHGLALGLNSNGKPEDYKPANGASQTDDFFNYGLAPAYHPSTPGNEYVNFGGHPMMPISYIYQSAKTALGEAFDAINQNTTIVSFATRLPDDTGTVSQNFAASVAMLRGKADFNFAANGQGTDQNGIRALPAFSLSQRATVVNSTDISRLVDSGFGNAEADVQQKYMDVLHSLVKERVSGDELKKLLGCSVEAAKEKLVTFSNALNPFDPAGTIGTDELAIALRQNFSGANNTQQIAGTVSYMLAKNLSVVGGLNYGGYDYHNQTSDGYLRNYNIFRDVVWPVVKYYNAIGKPIVLMLTSDGSTYCNKSIDPRQIMINGELTEVGLGANDGDRGRNGGGMMMVVSPQGRLPVKFHQVGHGHPNGIAGNPSNPIGESDNGNYNQVVLETIRRIMLALSPEGSVIERTFQEAAGGIRFNENLRPYVVI